MPADLLTLTRERAQANLFWRYLGVQVDDAGEGWVRLRVPVQDGLRNAAGGVGQATLDLNVSFLAAAGDGDILAEGRLLRRGRSVAFGEARITDGAGTLVAVGRATYMLLQPKP